MPRDFKCFTDAGFQVIFDPVAAAALTAASDSARFDVLHEEVKEGHAAARGFGDGDAFFRVFLEGEAVPRSMEKRAGKAVTGLLLAPTGRLHFAGLEDVAKPGAEVLDLEPGRYEVTLREMEWGELVERIADRSARRASPSGSRVNDVLGLLAGCLVVLTGIGGIAALIAVLNFGWSAWSDAWPWLLGAAAVIGVMALVWQTWPGAQAALDAQQATQARFPSTIVMLRKLGESDGPWTGCLLDDHV